ncbi:MAG TPA: co-chaperone GroES [Spirochaetota bacterium]|nr:co-chaperone GroES [Spirochaetota bacterium]
MTIQPLGDRVLVKISESESKTKSGLYIPENTKEKKNQGQVVAIGSSEDIKVKVGDVVLYDKYSGSVYTIDEEEHIILRNDDILAIIK